MMKYEGKKLPALQRVHARLEVVRTCLSLRRGLTDLYAAHHTDQTTVAMAVAMGHAEALLGLGRPFTVSQLEPCLEIPRPTIGRHLDALAAAGVVERYHDGTYALVAECANSAPVMTKLDRGRGPHPCGSGMVYRVPVTCDQLTRRRARLVQQRRGARRCALRAVSLRSSKEAETNDV
jgi:DNA-binding transcriptional ArsR family regulator